jgi:hypothetical protein
MQAEPTTTEPTTEAPAQSDPAPTPAPAALAPGELDVVTVEQYLDRMEELVVEDSDGIAAKLASKKLAARSIEELNKAGELETLESFLWRELIVTEIHWNEATIDGKKGAYCVFDLTDPQTGVVATIGCGHQDVMLKLFKVQQWQLLPCRVQFKTGKRANRFGSQTYLVEILGPPDTQTH